jgi:hypothetical protein
LAHVGCLIGEPSHLATKGLGDRAVVESGDHHVEAKGLLSSSLTGDVSAGVSVERAQIGLSQLAPVGTKNGEDRDPIHR